MTGQAQERAEEQEQAAVVVVEVVLHKDRVETASALSAVKRYPINWEQTALPGNALSAEAQ